MPRPSRWSKSRPRKTWAQSKGQKSLFPSLRSTASLKSLVNSLILKKAETKHYIGAADNIQLYHNCGVINNGFGAVIYNPWASITPGTGANNRIGTEIYPLGMSVRLEMFNKLDRPNITYRVIVLEIPKYVNGAVTSNQYDWRDAQGSNNVLLAFIKPDTGLKVLYDRIVRNEAHFSAIASAGAGDQDGKEAHMVHNFYVRANPRVKYVYDVNGQLVNKPWIVYVLPYDSYGTLQTDNIASCAINTKYFYKDC